MATPDSALRRLMRTTGKLLEPYAFDGDEPTWTRVEPEGVAAVGRTRTFRTYTGGQQVLSFGLTLSATPAPWWEFCNWRETRRGADPVPLAAATGPGLLTDSALPDSLTEMWSMRILPGHPGHVDQGDIELIRTELPRRVHAYARRALRLLEPGQYLEELLNLPDQHAETWEAIVVLLAEQGPSAHLDEAGDQLVRACTPDGDTDYARAVVDYARERAAGAGGVLTAAAAAHEV